MKKITIDINLYDFNELGKEAQELSILEHGCFYVDVYGEELSREDVVDSILTNEYLFYESGKLAHTLNYVGDHPRSGESVYIKNGVEYII